MEEFISNSRLKCGTPPKACSSFIDSIIVAYKLSHSKLTKKNMTNSSNKLLSFYQNLISKNTKKQRLDQTQHFLHQNMICFPKPSGLLVSRSFASSPSEFPTIPHYRRSIRKVYRPSSGGTLQSKSILTSIYFFF